MHSSRRRGLNFKQLSDAQFDVFELFQEVRLVCQLRGIRRVLQDDAQSLSQLSQHRWLATLGRLKQLAKVSLLQSHSEVRKRLQLLAAL